jgi:hypothetical protein
MKVLVDGMNNFQNALEALHHRHRYVKRSTAFEIQAADNWKYTEQIVLTCCVLDHAQSKKQDNYTEDMAHVSSEAENIHRHVFYLLLSCCPVIIVPTMKKDVVKNS